MPITIFKDHVEFNNEGEILSISFSQYPILLTASVVNLLEAKIEDEEIHFPTLDVDIAIASLVHPEKYPLRSYPKVIDVTPLDGYMLSIRFNVGVQKIYNCKNLLDIDVFKELADENLFRSVRISKGGYGIEWNDEIDIAEGELWEHGQ